MDMLAADSRVVFLGQAVRYAGTSMSGTLANVPMERRVELPVAEQMQLGVSIGLALVGFVPICVFPRMNFMILAADMLVNHLDKMGAHVIVRVGIGSEKPLHPGQQHIGDFTEAFADMCRNTAFACIYRPEEAVPAYEAALRRAGPSVIVEVSDLYHD